MKKLLILAVLLLLAVPASADPLKDGMSALKKNSYEEAAWHFASARHSGAKAGQGTFNLNSGIALAESAMLYRDLHGLSNMLHEDYLKKIASKRGRGRSRYARLYLGIALLEAGKPKEASTAFNKFIAEKRVQAKHRMVARAGLGLAYHRRGMKKKALEVWGQVKSSDPEVLSELANAYDLAGLGDRDPVKMADRAFELVKKSNTRPSTPVVVNLLGVYARAGHVDKGFELLRLAGGPDLKGYSYEEKIGKNTVIRFYDTRLLANLSAFYGTAAVKFLKNAEADPKLKGVAAFYLAQAHALLNDFPASTKAMEEALSSGRMPPQLKHKAEAVIAEGLFRRGKKDEAMGRINGLLSGNPTPAHLAEALLGCARVGRKCPGAATKAEAAARASQGGKRFAALNQAIGRYFLNNNDRVKAVKYLEDARDKGNKNKIEHNDPKLLTALAEAYYKTKQYSEALEIFFEMNRHFPAVRQIQVVLQGIYSMEQKSAGDVKIL